MDEGDQAGGDVVGGDMAPAEPFEPTGHERVDRVLASLDGIEERSVHEHVAVFEDAHAALRRALDGAEQE